MKVIVQEKMIKQSGLSHQLQQMKGAASQEDTAHIVASNEKHTSFTVLNGLDGCLCTH